MNQITVMGNTFKKDIYLTQEEFDGVMNNNFYIFGDENTEIVTLNNSKDPISIIKTY